MKKVMSRRKSRAGALPTGRGKSAKGRGLKILGSARRKLRNSQNPETNYNELRKRYPALLGWVDRAVALSERALLARLAEPAGLPGQTGLEEKETRNNRESFRRALPRGRVVCPGCGTVVGSLDQFGLVLFRSYSELKFRLYHEERGCELMMESRFHVLRKWTGADLVNLPQDIVL